MRNETVHLQNCEALNTMIESIDMLEAGKVLETLFFNYIQTDEYAQSLPEARKSLVFHSQQMYEFFKNVKR